MKKSKNKYTKLLITVLSLISIVIISILIYKKFENNKNILTDNIKFKSEYKSVPEDNLFVYSNINEIIKILESSTGVIFFSFPECTWCGYYAQVLNEAAQYANIDKIYYLNILDERKYNTNNYQKLTKILESHLLYNDEGITTIYAPDVTIVKNGRIIGHNNETSVIVDRNITPESYWTEERKETLKNELIKYFNNMK